MTLKRNIISIALSAIFALCLTFGLAFMPKQESTAYAEEQTSTFEMLGANVRLDANAGMRFTARLSEIDQNAEYGFIIFPADILTRFNVQIQTYSDSYDYLAEIEDKAKAYISAMTERNPDFSYTLDCDPVPYYEDEELVEYRLNATIAQVLYANLGRDFFGLAYKKTVENDIATYTYASYGDGFKRSVVYVASRAYDLYEEGTDGRAIIDSFLLKNMYYLSGVSEATANQNIENGQSLPSVALTLNNTSATIALQDTLALTATAKISGSDVTLNYPVTYTSNDEQVATVSADGEITAVGAGEATITATCYGATATCSVTVTTAEAYAINRKPVTNGTISAAATARENDTVTVTATPNKGYTLGFIRVDGERIVGNEFTMPAHAVSVDAVFVNAITYETITKIALGMGPTGFSGDSDNMSSTNATLSVSGDKQQHNGTNWYFDVYVTGFDGTQSTVTFTLANSNSSTTALNARIELHGMYDSTLSPSAATGGTIDGNKINVKQINAGGSQVVSITSGDYSGTLRIRIYPVSSDSENNYVGSFTISNIYFGTGAGGDVEVESYNTTVTNGSVDLIDAVPGETVTVTAAAPAGSDGFAYWSVVSGGVTLDDTTSDQTTFTMGDEAVQLKANYYYDIVLPATPAGIIATVGGESVTKAVAGATVTIATTAEGYTVTGFEYDGTPATTTFTMPEEEVEITNVTAVQGVTTYSITVNNGTASPTQAAKGTEITITANERTGYNFTGWEVISGGVTLGNASATKTTFTMGEANVEVRANYAVAVTYNSIASYYSSESKLVASGFSANDYSLTATSSRNYGGGHNDLIGIIVNGTSGYNTITFTVQNACTGNSDNTIKMGIRANENVKDQFDGTWLGITTVTGATKAALDGKDCAYIELSKGGSATITIKFATSFTANTAFKFSPYAYNQGFIGDLIISNISITNT
ncbi:MAG: Ig-like domain-containing protein [Clostridia bacterium]|nr:Ig-like domain-containing protein [Clostridia bacterium]